MTELEYDYVRNWYAARNPFRYPPAPVTGFLTCMVGGLFALALVLS